MHVITIQFNSAEDAKWAYRYLAQAMNKPRSLGRLDLGILQDSMARANWVGIKREATEPPIEYAPWETEGGTTEAQNEARFQ